MPKSVQGVQAVVQAVVQAYSHIRRGLCRVCRAFPYVTREKTNATTKKNKTASRIGYACTPCTPCTDHAYQRLANFRTLHNCLHTLHNL